MDYTVPRVKMYLNKQNKLRGFSPKANYTDWR
jgi:hypothetical protein